jgi:hypothetical protein
MLNRLTRFEKINVINIILTLILSAVAVILAYNSYNISITSLKISENTFILSEKVDKLNKVQAEIELKSSVFALFTTIDMQRQNDIEGKSLVKCIKTLNEMKSILEAQMKNGYLAQDSELSDLWIELFAKVNFDIKFLEEGLKVNTTVAGVKDILVELENKTKVIFDNFLEHNKKLAK